MTDQSLIARLRGYIGKASFATGADRYTVTTLLDELAAALTREQEAQPADDGLREDIQPINTGPKKPAVIGKRAAQPAEQEPGK